MHGRHGAWNRFKKLRQRHSFFFLTAATGLLLTFCPSILFGKPQTTRASGKVVDPEGAPVASAHVKVLAADGTVLRETATDQRGEFHFGEISPGKYMLTAEVSPFAPVTVAFSIG